MHIIYIHIYVCVRVCMYDNQIVHRNRCFNLFIIHNSVDNQGSEEVK